MWNGRGQWCLQAWYARKTGWEVRNDQRRIHICFNTGKKQCQGSSWSTVNQMPAWVHCHPRRCQISQQRHHFFPILSSVPTASQLYKPCSHLEQVEKKTQTAPSLWPVAAQQSNWILADCRLSTNEEADHLAKSGSTQEQPYLNICYWEARTWRGSISIRNGYRHTVPTMTRHICLLLYHSTTIFRPYTGHCCLCFYLYCMGLSQISDCLCRTVPQTPGIYCIKSYIMDNVSHARYTKETSIMVIWHTETKTKDGASQR